MLLVKVRESRQEVSYINVDFHARVSSCQCSKCWLVGANTGRHIPL